MGRRVILLLVVGEDVDRSDSSNAAEVLNSGAEIAAAAVDAALDDDIVPLL